MPAPTDSVPSSDLFRQRLVRLWTKYCPDKLNTIDETMKMYAGREEQMIAKNVASYGPEPIDASIATATKASGGCKCLVS